jgi:hypothetical protein
MMLAKIESRELNKSKLKEKKDERKMTIWQKKKGKHKRS